MNVQHAAAIPRARFGTELFHLAREHDQINPMLFEYFEDRFIETIWIRMDVRAEMEPGNPRRHRTIQHRRIGVVADDDARLGVEAAVAARVEDRLHIAASVRGEES